MITVELDSKRVDELAEFYTAKIKKIYVQINQLTDQLAEANREITAIEDFLMKLKVGAALRIDEEKNTLAIVNEYSAGWTWEQRIEFVCKVSDEPLKTINIIERIYKYEPYLNPDRGVILRNLRPLISNLINSKRIYKFHKKGEKGNYLIHNSWFDENGNIKDSHKEKFDMYGLT